MNQKGVLLVNLGSPDSPKVGDVRRYLRQFLMDGRVLDAPYPVRFFIVHGCILPSRPKQSAEAYAKIWLPEGSPLVVTSRKVQSELQRRMSIPIELAMRYQNYFFCGLPTGRFISAGIISAWPCRGFRPSSVIRNRSLVRC